MNKGYIVPAILIVLLLILAGFFVFIPSVSGPTIDPVVKNLPATSTVSEVQEVVLDQEGDSATSTDTDEIPLDTATTSDTI